MIPGVGAAHGTPATLAAGAVGSVILWLGLLLLLALLGGILLMWLRRRLLDSHDTHPQPGWDLASLRRLRDRGEITEEEFEAAKAEIIGSLAGPGTNPLTGEARPTPHSGDERRAPPGFDLTGEPLPDFPANDEGEAGEK